MKILRLISTTVVLVLVAVTVFIVSKPEKRDANLYAFYGTVINASNGEFQYTGALALANEKDLKSAAASASNNGTAILIGNGSGDPGEPITDIQIVGIGGVAYGNITECPREEE